MIVRPLVIPPADMDARLLRWDVAECVVQNLDVKFRTLQEIGFA